MNLFSLYATLTLDDKQYKKSVENAKKSASEMRSDVMKLAQTYKSQGMTMSDAMKKAYEDIDRSQYQTSNTAKSESEKTKKYWTGAALDISKGWDLLKTGFKTAVAGVAAVTGSLVAISAATEEYRIAQGKLNTAFEAAGYSSGTAKETYNAFYQILGDTDTATEASQLLAKLAQSEEDVTKWTDIAAGVWGTFGDALPIEGLIESANETAKVGEVTGSLADALNWAGISEDDFNDKLAAAGSEAERNRLIMETLAGTYDTAADSFYKNNEQIIKNREQQTKLTEAMANVGNAVDKVKSAFVERFMPAISDAAEKVSEWLNGLDVNAVIDTAIDKITEIKDIFVDWLPVIAGVTGAIVAFRTAMTVSVLIGKATKAISDFKKAQEAATIAQAALNFVMNLNPFVLIATAVVGLTAALAALWFTNEDFRNAVIGIWENIKEVISGVVDAVVGFFTETVPNALEFVKNAIIDGFTAAWEGIKSVWDLVKPYFDAIWNGIKTIFSVVGQVLTAYFQAAWNGVMFIWNAASGYFQNIFNTIKGIFSAVTTLFRGDFQGAWDAIKDVLSGWGDYFQGLFDSIGNIFAGIFDFFKNIGGNIIQGIKDGIAAAWDGLVSWFNGLWDSLFGKKSVNVNVNTTETRTVKTVRGVDGSHASGLYRVPFDGYIAELHKGERVLTAKEAKAYNAGGPINITINAAAGQNVQQIAQAVAKELEFQRRRQVAGI